MSNRPISRTYCGYGERMTIESFIRSTQSLIAQRRGRPGWRPLRAHSQASGGALPAWKICSRFCDDKQERCPTMRTERQLRRTSDRRTAASPHCQSTTESNVCQAGQTEPSGIWQSSQRSGRERPTPAKTHLVRTPTSVAWCLRCCCLDWRFLSWWIWPSTANCGR